MKHWPKYKGYSWETAPFLRILLPIVAGIVLYQYGHPYPHKSSAGMLIAVMGLGIISFITAAFLHYRKTIKHSGIAIFTLFQIMWLCLSWSCSYISNITNNPNWFGHFTQSDEACLAVINQPLQEKEKSFQTTIQVIGALHQHKYYPRTGYANLYIYKNSQTPILAPGDTLIIPAKWVPIKNNLNPFALNFEQLQAQKGLYFNCFLPQNKMAIYNKLNTSTTSLANTVHQYCLRQIARYISDTQACALTQAMLLGDVQNLNPFIIKAYAATGIVHIIAISGGNIGILFLTISFALSVSRISKKVGLHYALAILPVWCYVYIAGMGPSAVRAATMFTVAAIGQIINKKNNSLNQLMASACILLLAQPSWLFSLGFQLSFTAVLSLTLFFTPILNLYKSKYLILHKFWNLIAASLAAQILVAPLVIYYFHLFPLLFLIANAAAFVFMGIVLVAAIIIIVCGHLPLIPKCAGALAQFIIIHFNSLVFKLQHLNPPFFNNLVLHVSQLFVVYIIIAAIAFYSIKQFKVALPIALASACIFLGISCQYSYIAGGQRKLVAFNTKSGSQIFYIAGHYNTPLSTRPANANTDTLNSSEALCMWSAWQKKYDVNKNTFIFQGKKVLVLQAPFYANAAFHVDALIINYNLQPPDLQSLYTCFTPQQIILAYNGPAKNTQNCYETALQANIPLYCVKYQGAFILSAN